MDENGSKNQGGRSAFAQRLAAMSERQTAGKKVGEILQETNEGLMYSDLFFRTIAEGDTLGIALFRGIYGYTPQKAAQEWFKRSWQEWKETILLLAIGHSETAKKAHEEHKPLKEVLALAEPNASETAKKAGEIVATVETFEENPLVLATLGEVLTAIGRPSRQIYSAAQLTAFLGELTVKDLAIRSADKPGWRKAFEWERAWYTRTNTQKARVAWPFVLRALGRVRRFLKVQGNVFPRIQELIDQATIPSNPEEQNLNRLLQRVTDVGSMVVFDPASQVRNKEGGTYDPAGLFAILIARPSAGSSTLSLMGVVADAPLPSVMHEGIYELPPLAVHLQVDGELEIGFNIQNRLAQDEFDAVMRIQHLLRQWLKQEGRFQMPALPATTSAR